MIFKILHIQDFSNYYKQIKNLHQHRTQDELSLVDQPFSRDQILQSQKNPRTQPSVRRSGISLHLGSSFSYPGTQTSGSLQYADGIRD